MIIEGVCTTINDDGSPNIAPMGPVVNEELTNFLFRPFQTSATFQNLKRTGQGVFHVTDDVGLIARAAIGKLDKLPELKPAEHVHGNIIQSACRWYEFEVVAIDDSHQRSEISTHIVHQGTLRDYWGFNRARHAILEAAILATRLHILDRSEIMKQMETFQVIVDKTASASDVETFELLSEYISI